ncbi:hypothetical protein MAR_007943 [Mya arenaria]|uniref:Uncharacterized protein n=1 Tax=Mya arenaria TaxID=6604 RepID=A0ABY7DUJ4_MYAAR|nr:hypothetical protein MAR_007943 [Mya arenaria]
MQVLIIKARRWTETKSEVTILNKIISPFGTSLSMLISTSATCRQCPSHVMNVLIITIAKPDKRADVLLDALSLALLRYNFLQERAVVECWLDIWFTYDRNSQSSLTSNFPTQCHFVDENSKLCVTIFLFGHICSFKKFKQASDLWNLNPKIFSPTSYRTTVTYFCGHVINPLCTCMQKQFVPQNTSRIKPSPN